MLQRLTLEGPQVAANSVRALVLVPTRELAEQVHASIRDYGQHLPLRTAVAYGGQHQPADDEAAQGVDILVATPGRLLDLYRQNAVKFAQLQALVLDEADRMLDLGFARELDELFGAAAQAPDPAVFRDLLRRHPHAGPRTAARPAVHRGQSAQYRGEERQAMAGAGGQEAQGRAVLPPVADQSLAPGAGLRQDPQERRGTGRTVAAQGIAADSIHGDKPQPARLRALQRFKAGEVDLLVATDVAARGLDIEEMPLVVNFDLPIVAEDYVHRIGRTGRAGLGQAVSLVCADEVELLAAIETLIGQTLQRREEPDFEPEHRVPQTAPGGVVLKKPKKPKKPKAAESAGKPGKIHLGSWFDSSAPTVKAVRKAPGFGAGAAGKPKKRPSGK